MRETGILMPLASLPSRAGIGELGRETERFIGYLRNAGVTIWQILPLNPVGYGNSPYQPYSSCAGDEIYISLEKLWEQGLLQELPPEFGTEDTKIRYDAVRAFKEPYFKEAFAAFEQTEEYRTFAAQSWVQAYGMFRALKKENGNVCWNEWRAEDKNRTPQQGEAPEAVGDEAAYHIFLQYLFFCQWMEIKALANESGIRIMGDVPFYVGVDSVDVWAGKENFLLDTDGRPIFIAGVPPDYFSATGQRWGNPIYNWEHLKENGYQFWVDRIGYNSRLFDIIRIDHFRAFDTFWKIPASCPTAIEGEWVEAPGYEVLDTLFAKIPGVDLVAEDSRRLKTRGADVEGALPLEGNEDSSVFHRHQRKICEGQLPRCGKHDHLHRNARQRYADGVVRKALGGVKKEGAAVSCEGGHTAGLGCGQTAVLYLKEPGGIRDSPAGRSFGTGRTGAPEHTGNGRKSKLGVADAG